jgi:hypothetical protein
MRQATWSMVGLSFAVVLGFFATFNAYQTGDYPYSKGQQQKLQEMEVAQEVCPTQNSILTERKGNIPGYIPPFVPTSQAPFNEQFEVETPQLNKPMIQPGASNVLFVSPPSEGGPQSWEEMLSPNKDIYLLMPGDYRSLGVFTPLISGTASQPKVLRSYYPPGKCTIPGYGPVNHLDNIHPYQLKDSGCEVVLEGFDLKSNQCWTIGYVTFRGNNVTLQESYKCNPWSYYTIQGGNGNVIYQGRNHVIHSCLFEKVVKGGYLRIVDSENNVVQNSVFNGKFTERGQDFGGVKLDASEGNACRNNQILSNEFINIDGVAMDFQHPCEVGWGGTPYNGILNGTFIANNDIYLDQDYQPCYVNNKLVEQCACAEDGMDIKNGSNDPEEPVVIQANRIFNYRVADQCCGGTGGTGPGILIHQNAKNIVVKDNIIFNTTAGVKVEYGNKYKGCYLSNNQTLVTNIVITNNFIANLHQESFDTQAEISGVGIYNRAEKMSAYYNTILNAPRLLNLRKSLGGGQELSHHIQCNTFLQATEECHFFPFPPGCPPNQGDPDSKSGLNAWFEFPSEENIYVCNLPEWTNEYGELIEDSKLGCYTIFVKRWTNPEAVTFDYAVPTINQAGVVSGPKITPFSKCDCYEGLCYPEGWNPSELPVVPDSEKSIQLITRYEPAETSAPLLPEDVRIYPNPFHNRFQVQIPLGENGQLLVFDSRGLELTQHPIREDSAVEVDLSGQPAGIYFLKILLEDRVLTRPIIKQ